VVCGPPLENPVHWSAPGVRVILRLCATPACLRVVEPVISKSNSCAPIMLRGTTVMAMGSAGCLRPIASDVVELLQHWRKVDARRNRPDDGAAHRFALAALRHQDTCPRIGSLRRHSGAASTRIGASRRPSTGSARCVGAGLKPAPTMQRRPGPGCASRPEGRSFTNLTNLTNLSKIAILIP
jgi:hypothetical protein